MNRNHAFANKQLNTFPIMPNTSFPILGRLSATNILELIGSEPVAIEEDAGPFGPLTQFGQVE